MRELGVHAEKTKLYVDSQSLLDTLKMPVNKSKMSNRRQEICQMKEFVKTRDITHIESDLNRADVLTKPYSPKHFDPKKFNLNVYNNQSRLE